MKDNAEFRLTCAIAEHLHFRAPSDCYWTHHPFGEARSARTGARLKRMGTRAGAPDFLLIYRSRAYGLELKAVTRNGTGREVRGRQTDTQRLTEELWTAAGGAYRVATGLDEALSVLREWGILPASYHFEPAKRRQLPLELEAAE